MSGFEEEPYDRKPGTEESASVQAVAGIVGVCLISAGFAAGNVFEHYHGSPQDQVLVFFVTVALFVFLILVGVSRAVRWFASVE